jgi:hypothetical protein
MSLRLDKNIPSSNQVIYSDVPTTGSLVIIDFTSSYDHNLSSNYNEFFPLTSSIISNKTRGDGGWLSFEVSSSQVPTSSGQFTSNVYEVGQAQVVPAIWNRIDVPWNTVPYTWAEFKEVFRYIRGKRLSSDIAYVEKANDTPINNYTSSLNRYNTYQ